MMVLPCYYDYDVRVLERAAFDSDLVNTGIASITDLQLSFLFFIAL